jgi:hypothetical protein
MQNQEPNPQVYNFADEATWSDAALIAEYDKVLGQRALHHGRSRADTLERESDHLEFEVKRRSALGTLTVELLNDAA